MSDRHRTQTIEIPEHTAEALLQRLEHTEFDSIDDYAAFALDQLLDELRRQAADSGDPSATAGTDKNSQQGSIENSQQDSVEDRLESLGYL